MANLLDTEYVLRGFFITKGTVYFAGKVIQLDAEHYKVDWLWTKDVNKSTIMNIWDGSDVRISALKKYTFIWGIPFDDDTFTLCKVQRKG